MATQTLSEELNNKISAGISGIWLQSYEHEDAVEEMRQLCHAQQWMLVVWDCARGGQQWLPGKNEWKPLQIVTPEQAVNALAGLNQQRPEDAETPVLMVIKNGHRFMETPLIQCSLNQVWEGQKSHQHLIILTHTLKMPVELEKSFTIVQHQLPDRGQLDGIGRRIGDGGEWKALSDEDRESMIDAACGLARLEATNAFALSLVEHNAFHRRTIFEFKAQMLKKGNQAATLYEGAETFADIGGLAAVKAQLLELLGHRETNPKFRPRGVLCFGISGSGKSLLAKALGAETGRPTVVCDLNATQGSLVGQTETQMREMLHKIDAMEPNILFVD